MELRTRGTLKEELFIVHYCHPGCAPFRSITRLPEEEAFAAARRLAEENDGTAFGRFADFGNYYPRRIRTEKWLYDWFVRIGGEPGSEHPLYFVLSGSDYLDDWFGRGKARKIPLSGIDARHISFTFGDSMARMDKPERRDPFTLETLYAQISARPSVGAFLAEIQRDWNYVEVQLWEDRYVL